MSKEFLEVEVSRGAEYERCYNSMVKPFIEAKKKELFEAFVSATNTSDSDLVKIKLQANALQSLEDEFTSFINTGKIASQQLEENNDE